MYIRIQTFLYNYMSMSEASVFSLICFKRNNTLTNMYIAKTFNIAKSTVITIIKKLIAKNFIIKSNNSKSNTYEICFNKFKKEEMEMLIKDFSVESENAFINEENEGSQNTTLKGSETLPQGSQNTTIIQRVSLPINNIINKEIIKNKYFSKNKFFEKKHQKNFSLIKKNKENFFKEKDILKNNKEKDLKENILVLEKDILEKHKKSFEIKNINYLYKYFVMLCKEKGIIVSERYMPSEIGSLKYVLKILKQENIDPKEYLDFVFEEWKYLQIKLIYPSGLTKLKHLDFCTVFYKNSFTEILQQLIDKKTKPKTELKVLRVE